MKRLLIICLISISGCALLKTTQKSINEASVSEDKQKTIKASEANTNMNRYEGSSFSTDSTADGYQIVVKPKGRFSFSPEDGFAGEAESVLISGWRKGVKNRLENSSADEQSSTKREVELKENTSSNHSVNQEIKASFFNWKVLLVAFILLSLAFFLVWLRWFKR